MMFFKKIKKLVCLLLLAYFIIPQNILAYSNKIIASGENIGITLNANGILIVGTYEINNESPAQNAGIKKGDIIKKINSKEIYSIKEMAEKINETNSDEIEIEYKRNDQIKKTKLKLYKDESNIYKTGLFVKDSITGIGTLTFIDPKTKKFGALGHEIREQATEKIFEIKEGTIYNSNVTGIIPSDNGKPGEKKAEYNKDEIKGKTTENTTQGIFGTYTENINDLKTYEVATPDKITTGPAKIITVLKNHETKEYDINIIQVNSEKQKNKNFIFEITDKELLNKTNGIIQGMSGSPIIKDNMILGAITHVVINDPHKGYGIFITNMLEEAEN
ncbi:MAG: SpoIVB peptidase [Bacilli bacterium]|nr:SpoIVB peptidase [Bacilli bacterium]